MAGSQVTNTYDSFDASATNREDLSNVIELITPKEAPFFSLIGTDKAKNTKTEWLIDTLRNPSLTNYNVQGFSYDYNAVTPATRVSNVTQIFQESKIIAETQEAVDTVGGSDVKKEKAKMLQSLKIDMDVTMLSNQASVVGDGATPARMGGLRAWLATNDRMGSNGASGGFNSSTGVVDAATNGTQRAFTKTIMDDAIEQATINGGRPTVIMGSTYVKRVFSTFMSDANVAQLRMNVTDSKAKLVGAVDAYLSDFGLLNFVPNVQMTRAGATIARNVYLLDTARLKKSWLRPVKEDMKVAKTSDGIPIVIKGEITLKVMAEASCAVAADIFGLTSAS